MWQARTFPYPIHTIHKSPGRIPYSGPRVCRLYLIIRYLILVLGVVSRSCSSTSSHDLCCPTIGAEAAYLILVLGFVGCGVLAVVRHSVRTRKQPTTTHTEFSWTRVVLDPPLASRHFGDGDGAVHGTGTVHHRRTLL